MRAFVHIFLVDIHGIDPKRNRFVSTTQVLEGDKEFLRHSKTAAIESDELLHFDATSSVR